MNAFLNSTSNIDYVQQILLGVSVVMQARYRIKDKKIKKFESGQYSHRIVNGKRIIHVKYITITNPEDWIIFKKENNQ